MTLEADGYAGRAASSTTANGHLDHSRPSPISCDDSSQEGPSSAYFSQMPNNFCLNGTTITTESQNGHHATSNARLAISSSASNGAQNSIILSACDFCAHCSKLSNATNNHQNTSFSSTPGLRSARGDASAESNRRSSHDDCSEINEEYSHKVTAVASSTFAYMNGVGNSRKGSQCGCDWVDLNVGGKIFKTTRMTLSKVPGSFLDCLCNNQNLLSSHVDQTGISNFLFFLNQTILKHYFFKQSWLISRATFGLCFVQVPFWLTGSQSTGHLFWTGSDVGNSSWTTTCLWKASWKRPASVVSRL